MPVTISGTSGIVSPGVDSTNLILDGSTSGSITVLAPAVAGSNTQTLVATTGTLAPIVSGTAVASTSGTSIDFTGIPSWVKRITVMFSSVSLSGTSYGVVQIGSGSITTTGYVSGGALAGGTNSVNGLAATNGIICGVGAAGSNIYSGTFTLVNITGNTWVGSACGGFDSAQFSITAGGKLALSGVLDRIRITTINGTDTFDAGTINILYE